MKDVFIPLEQNTIVTIGEIIANIRRTKGLTQNELAKTIGVSQKVISRYERGTLRINDNILKLIAISLSVSSDLLLGIDKNEKNVPYKINIRMAQRLNKLSKLLKSTQKVIIKNMDLAIQAAEAQQRE